MENEKPISQEGETSSVYIIGAVIVVAIIIAGVLLWPKPKPATTTSTTPVVEEKAMITKLSCDKQWFNPMIGFPKYYLSAEGGALLTAKGVTCTFTVTANTDGKVLTTESIPAVLRAAEERGGQTFQCTTKALELIKGAAVTMTTLVKDNQGATASCAAGTMILP
ncbi:MAG: hypothetical protein V1917_02550 [Candidatus Gottesmanbacteria bacterium]